MFKLFNFVFLHKSYSKIFIQNTKIFLAVFMVNKNKKLEKVVWEFTSLVFKKKTIDQWFFLSGTVTTDF